jgi:CubicO group peptidase (beta-lactamase class C family)
MAGQRPSAVQGNRQFTIGKMGTGGMMRINVSGGVKVLAVAVMGCMSATLAAGQNMERSTASIVAAKENGRAQIAAHAAEWLKESDVPSMAVAYIKDGKVAWTEVYGEQSPGVPATGKTLYNLASLTKPITAETVLRLASAGKLSLDESMSPFWLDPDIKDDPWSKLLTPRLCLSHQTGFANWRRMTGGVLKMRWEPGTQTGYSGEGYMYLGRFTENKMAKPFDALAQKMVFDPIGMKDTSYTAKEWYAGRLAVPHGPKGETPIDPAVTTWNGADLVRTTIGDYAKFVVSVMHDEGLTKEIAVQRATMTRELVKPEELDKMCKIAGETEHCTISAGMGLGWEVKIVNGVKILEHNGGDWGVRTFAMFVPSQGIGVIVFTNGDNGTDVIRKVAEALYPNQLYLATM